MTATDSNCADAPITNWKDPRCLEVRGTDTHCAACKKKVTPFSPIALSLIYCDRVAAAER